MSKSLFGIATTHGQAERIVEQLQAEGFAASEISVLMPDTGGTRDVGHVKATKAPEGATTGAATGGAAGGVIGLLAGIGALANPGVGPFIAAGPIMAALSGAAVGAATRGRRRRFDRSWDSGDRGKALRGEVKKGKLPDRRAHR
jgi:hypothetical protein